MIKYISAVSKAIKKGHEGGMKGHMRMGFAIEDEAAHDPAKAIEAGLKRQIVKRGQSFRYVIESAGLANNEIRLMEEAKWQTIEEMSREEEIGIGLLERAKAAAKNFLAGMENEKAAYAAYIIAHDTVGYGAVSVLMEDKANIEEIEINSPEGCIEVYTTEFGRCSTNIRFTGEEAYRRSINMLVYSAEKELGEATPIIDAQVENARVHAQIRPYAISGAAASIRLGKGKEISLYSMLKRAMLSTETAAYLWMAIESGLNIIISGAPASGKTTMLSALGIFMQWHEKLVTIEEDINELRFNMPMLNVAALYGTKYGSISTRNQVINALRMRPERIIIGEVRGEETREIFAGANLGVPFMTTMHSSDESISILKKLLIKPMEVDTRALSMLDLSIYMRQSGLSERGISGITEYRWLSRAETENGTEIENGDAVRLEMHANARGVARARGSKCIAAYAEMKGISAKAACDELEKRSSYVKRAAQKAGTAQEFELQIRAYR